MVVCYGVGNTVSRQKKTDCSGGRVSFFVVLQRFFLWCISIPERKRIRGTTENGENMSSGLIAILENIEQERGISKEQLMTAIENALASGFKKGVHSTNDVIIRMDRKTGAIKVWAKMCVVEVVKENDQISLAEAKTRIPSAEIGDIVEWEVTPSDFGRIAAQTAGHAIKQQLRKAEKELVGEEFKEQIGELINGTVRRIDAGNVIVDCQKAEGIIAAKDRVAGESYQVGDRINAILVRVDTETAGPALILSRSSVNFIRKLFEREVSEIHDGIVEIMGIAREAGIRTKIAVRSTDPRVDAVSACVGVRGLRVRNITNELGNERVDIIRYDDDPHVYLANAMQPAKILGVEEDRIRKQYTVYVNEENSRLAYGRKAQNVRLAQKLLQWTINIEIEEPEEEPGFEEQKQQAVENLASQLSISAEQAEVLVNNGYLSLDGLKEVSGEDLAKIEELEDATLQAIDQALGR